MILKEIERLRSDCSATSSINALLIVHCLPYLSPWPCAMGMPEHYSTFSLSLVSFWRTATFLLLLRKAFPAFSVNSTTSLIGNRRGNILKTSTRSISELPTPLLDHFFSSSSHFCTPFLDRPSSSILEPSPKTKFQFWPRSLRSDSGTGREGTPPDSLGSSPEVYTP